MARARIVLAVTAALALGATAELVALAGDVWEPWEVALDALPGVVSVAAGAAAWQLRPDSRTGPLMVAIGGLFFFGAFGYGRNQALVDLVGFPLAGWFDVMMLVLLLAITPGGLHERSPRVIVTGAVLSHLVLSLDRLLLRPPNDLTSCLCVPNRITGVTDPDVYNAVARAASLAEAAFALAAIVLLVLRWRASGPAARRVLGLLLAAGIATAAIVTDNRVVTRVLTDPVEPGEVMSVVLAAVRIAVPIAIVVSLMRGRRTRGQVAEVLMGLDRRGVEAGLGSARRALADPGLRLVRLPDEPLPEPATGEAVTVLERDGVRLGALVHDAALLEEPELLEAVAAAARLALHNERLAAEAGARLREVQASRQRIVEAADAERVRLERDLHDGAQQRLLGLALRLRMLERREADAANLALADELDALAAEIDATLGEIRTLARGIRPPALAEVGLEVALEALADRLGLRVEVDVQTSAALPDAVEATAYFAAAEALANVHKHAAASSARVEIAEKDGQLVVWVADEGRGGADPAAGSGLVGLTDRLEALGGSLRVESAAGAGTTLVAAIPLQTAPVDRR
jgi:signal transduction histidine kinase